MRGGGIRIAIRVRPGASRTKVGGRYGESLVVAVSERAVDGAATDAALAAVAEALDLRRRQIELVQGRASRDKVVEIVDVSPRETTAIAQRLAQLLAGG